MKELGIFLLLLLICTVTAVKEPNFLGAYNLQNDARQIGTYGIFSIGMGLVIITGGIDLSVGSLLAILAVRMGLLLSRDHWPWQEAVAVCLVGIAGLGLIHGLLITRGKLQPFIVTLCGLLIYRSLARVMAGDATVGLGSNTHLHYPTLWYLAKGKLWSIPMPFVVLLATAAIMWVVLHRSVYGRYLIAVGRNEDAARYSGINSKRVITSAYILCALLAGVSGILMAFDINSISPSDFGLSYELYGIAGAVLGGCSLRGGEGSILGIVIGTALLVVLGNVVNLLGIPSAWNDAVIGSVILIGVLADQVILYIRTHRRASAPVKP